MGSGYEKDGETIDLSETKEIPKGLNGSFKAPTLLRLVSWPISSTRATLSTPGTETGICRDAVAYLPPPLPSGSHGGRNESGRYYWEMPLLVQGARQPSFITKAMLTHARN